MKYSEIPSAKKTLNALKEQVARLEKEIRQAELNAEMNRIEAEDAKIVATINMLRSMFPESDASAAHVINSLKKRSSELATEWKKVHHEYFYL